MQRRKAARIAPPDPVRVAAWGFGIVFVFGALGTYETQTFDLLAFNLNAEGSVPSIFSSALWIAAGVMAFWAAGVGAPAAGAWVVLGALLVYLGVDEALALHERLEKLAGVSYQRLYAPLMLAGAVAGAVVTLRAIRRDWRVAALLVTGAAAAAAAQLIDVVQWENDQFALPYWTTVPEELLEMTGLLLVGLSALLEVRRRVSADTPGDRPPAAPAPATAPAPGR